MDTIFALASALGKSGVAVIRVSGPRSHAAASTLAGKTLPQVGRSLCTLRDGKGEHLDQALVLTFSGPSSFTGEDIAEFQVHGSVAGVSAILGALGKMENLRPAQPGEFTRRALDNGKLDLVQVEALADLIDSETEAQRRQAFRVLSGELGKKVDAWRRDLVRAAALIEATIDFADEEVPTDVTPEVESLLGKVQVDLDGIASGVRMAERIRIGFEVAIVGPPNVGKSTLLNAISGREAAITSEYAGTTRDVLEVRMDLGGLAVTLMDTAGLRETEDHVERIGIERAVERSLAADLRVFLTDESEDLDVRAVPGDIVVGPKGDLRGDAAGYVSGKTGAGVDRLIADIQQELSSRSSEAGLATRERHRLAMMSASESICESREILRHGPDSYEIAAQELRIAISNLESLVGRVDVEDLLDEIFSSFCLGK